MTVKVFFNNIFFPWVCIFLFVLTIVLFFYCAIFFLKKEKISPINFFGLKFGSYRRWAPILIFLVCSFLAWVIWQYISYESYYHGLASSVQTHSDEYIAQATDILVNSDFSEQEITNKLTFLASCSIAGITITNKGKQIIKTEPKYRKDATPESKPEPDYTNKTQNIEFTFKYAVQPPGLTGIEKALLCSFSEIFRKQEEKLENGEVRILSFSEKYNTWREGFFTRRHWRRSIDLYFPLILLFAFLCPACGFWYKQRLTNKELELTNEELELTNEELERTNRELESFKVLHKRLYEHLKQEAEPIKERLEETSEHWDKFVERTFRNIRHGMIDRYGFLFTGDNYNKDEKAIGIKFKNDFLKNVKDFTIMHLNHLEKTVSYGLQETSIKYALDAITQDVLAIPSSFTDPEHKAVNFDLTNNFDIKENEICNVNTSHLSSIVNDILMNANAACESHSQKILDKEENGEAPNKAESEYKRHIWMEIERISKDSKDYIGVTITDNGGGFTDEQLEKAYRVEIESLNNPEGEKRKGNGTMLVKSFAKHMNIDIATSNCIAKDNNKGAKVTLLIPIYIKQAEEKLS